MPSDSPARRDAAPPRSLPTGAVPVLFYRDAPAMIDWLERAFGFERRLVVPGENGTVRHSELALGASVIMVSSSMPERKWRSAAELGAASAGVCIYVADPDSHHARAIAAGAEILFPLKDSDYGSRDYTARDPEGTSWTFGTYIPGEHWTADSAK